MASVVITLKDTDGNVVQAAEEGVLVVSGTFKDDAGATTTPSAAAWTLTNAAGTVINARSAIGLSAASTYQITLSGGDLALSTAEAAGTAALSPRRLLIAYTYSSDAGSNLPGKAEVRFSIAHLAGVT